MTFEAPLPEDFLAALKLLRQIWRLDQIRALADYTANEE
jgi:hypothetical protein